MAVSRLTPNLTPYQATNMDISDSDCDAVGPVLRLSEPLRTPATWCESPIGLTLNPPVRG
jgi:hypothetical protein